MEILEKIVAEKKHAGVGNAVIMNYLKEYLQYPVLDFIYNTRKYNNFIFTGGSCLRICFGAPRLSEDLDFDLPKKDWDALVLDDFGKEAAEMFRSQHLLTVKIKVQSDCRVYLKFPVLKRLGLAGAKAESDFLFVKIEPNLMKRSKNIIDTTAVSRYGYNFIVSNHKLSYLMASKILAIFGRVWYKGKKNEVDIKGRDFYDLFWYLQNKVEPNWQELAVVGISNKAELRDKLFDLIDKKVTAQKLVFDLSKFFPDQVFVDEFCKNYKQLIVKYL